MKGQKNSSSKPKIGTVLKVFKNAFVLIAARAEGGHEKYFSTDADWQNFTRVQNPDSSYLDAELRHCLEIFGSESEGRLDHLAAAAWSSMARLEIAARRDGRSLEEIFNEIKNNVNQIQI